MAFVSSGFGLSLEDPIFDDDEEEEEEDETDDFEGGAEISSKLLHNRHDSKLNQTHQTTHHFLQSVRHHRSNVRTNMVVEDDGKKYGEYGTELIPDFFPCGSMTIETSPDPTDSK